MQPRSAEQSWFRVWRAAALMLALTLSLEWTVPLGGYAQPSQQPTSTPAVSVGTQDLPPMQEAEVIEQRKPYYKTWWFWTIVGVVLVGGGAAAAMSGGDSSSSPPPSGNVTITGPAPP